MFLPPRSFDNLLVRPRAGDFELLGAVPPTVGPERDTTRSAFITPLVSDAARGGPVESASTILNEPKAPQAAELTNEGVEMGVPGGGVRARLPRATPVREIACGGKALFFEHFSFHRPGIHRAAPAQTPGRGAIPFNPAGRRDCACEGNAGDAFLPFGFPGKTLFKPRVHLARS